MQMDCGILGSVEEECSAVFFVYSEGDALLGDVHCDTETPSGFGIILVAMLSVSLGLEFMEEYLGYKQLKAPSAETRLSVVVSVAEAGGLLIVVCLLWLWQGIHSTDDYVYVDSDLDNHEQFTIRWQLVAIVALTCLGALSEISFALLARCDTSTAILRCVRKGVDLACYRMVGRNTVDSVCRHGQ